MDLSRLPEPLRQRVEQQLARLPAEYRAPLEARLAKLPADKLEEVLSRTSPMLQKIMAKVEGGGTTRPGVRDPIKAPTHKGHFNATIQPGDRDLPAWPLAVLLVGAIALAWFQGWL